MKAESDLPPPEMVALAPDGGPGLDKTVIHSGVGPSAGNGSRVRLRYAMHLSGLNVEQAFDSSSSRLNGVLEFTVGRRRVMPAMELIAASMSVGEKCEVVCAPKYAFGSTGLKRKNVPPNATIVVHAEMVSFEGGVAEKPFAEMSASERFAKAELFKEQGNKLFKETKYEKAVAEYSNAIRLLANIFSQPMVRPEVAATVNTNDDASTDAIQTSTKGQPDEAPSSRLNNVRAAPALMTDHDHLAEEASGGFQEAEVVIDATAPGKDETIVETSTPNGVGEPLNEAQSSLPVETDENVEVDAPSETQVVSLHVRTLNNLSLCCFKLGQHGSAEEGATLAIRLDEKNFKGFYYRARARVAMGKLVEARKDLLVAAKMKPQNMGIRTELESVDKKLRQQKLKERKQAEAMFA